ncbi:MAG TPA: hypothetical protein VMW30_07670 [Candidatus Paceibacterota bacterium]|nr:hypothetical protein [Candidatus Paceibacterota bacterium]
MAGSLHQIDFLLTSTESVDEATPTAILRQWRTDLVRASVSVSYAIGVLSLDIEVLNHSLTSSSEDVLQVIVDDLPRILASGWIEGGWSISPVTEFAIDQAEALLGLHAEMVTSNLSDHAAVHDLLARTKQERQVFYKLRGQLNDRLSQIQDVVRKQYAAGVASIDDWLK